MIPLIFSRVKCRPTAYRSDYGHMLLNYLQLYLDFVNETSIMLPPVLMIPWGNTYPPLVFQLTNYRLALLYYTLSATSLNFTHSTQSGQQTRQIPSMQDLWYNSTLSGCLRASLCILTFSVDLIIKSKVSIQTIFVVGSEINSTIQQGPTQVRPRI